MIPLRDNIPSRTTPVVNYAVIACCAVVFLMQRGDPTLVEQYGMIPARVQDPDNTVLVPERAIVQTNRGPAIQETKRPAAESAVPAWLTPLTCIFLHGGWMHILGNMWFLYIFGDNVEDRLGHVGYVLFYLGTGVAASLAHFLTDPASSVPTIGASGAIAGVMGAYFVLYPRSMVLTLIPIFFFIEIVVLPAPLFLGVWFAIQFFQGTMASGATGVAWWAHIGGFAAGFAVAWWLKKTHHTRPAVERVLPNTGHFTHYRYHRRDPWS